MTVHIALLRAVNLPSHNKIAMRDLVPLFAGVGLHDAQSLLQTGNVVFRSTGAIPAQLERRLEEAARKRLGLTTDVFVRTAREWQAVMAGNPFPDEAERDPSHLLVVCLKEAPDRRAEAALRGAIIGREAVCVRDRQAYIVYPDGIGRSRVTAAVIEKHLGTRGTGRNWNTVLRLAALAGLR